ncbi:MAG TPA: Gfo/Idh/MocA family oxidoreductase [Anaerolineae bacterium]|nr:Gfo/Idh/MocA family oxidoreductase [Anaerolineae bacterium]HQH39282.1 Gfo/Idh/MocA family oxidoreductase [Anaerolineae bacterium]
MKPLKMGLIGTGGIAQVHMRALAKTQDIEVVAVCDIVEEKAIRTAQEFGVPNVFVDYHDLLAMDEIEAVNICTWNQAHRAPAVDALHAGKHVLCEKPMAATLEDATAMTKAVHETGLVFMVGVQPRFGFARKTAKAIVDSGALGDIYYAEAVACRRCGIPGGSFIKAATAGIGTVADIGVYALDEVLHLMGHPKPVAVSGIANNILGKTHKPVEGSWYWVPEDLEVEDFGVATVRFENGALMVFKTAWIMHMDSLGSNLLLGTKAGMKMDPLTIFTHDYNRLVDIKPLPGDARDGDLFLAKNMAFAEAIWNGTPSPVPADEMLITNVIIQGLIDSAACGHEVKVSVPAV